MLRAGNPRQKTAVWLTEGKPDIPANARAHQGRRSAGIGKGHDALQRMQRITCHSGTGAIGHYVFSIQGKIYIL